MSGYTRQQTYIDGDVILAEHTNDEFDLLEEVFSTSLGHKHDGTTAEGHTIALLSDNDGDTKIQVEETADEDIIRFDTAAVERMTIGATGTVTTTGNLVVGGTGTFSSDVGVIGNFTTDTIFTGRPAFNGGTSGVDSPFTVDSTFVVTNLNSDLLDGVQGSDYARISTNNTFTGSSNTFQGSTNTDVIIRAGNTTGLASLYFGDSDAAFRGMVRYDNTAEALELSSNGIATADITIASTGFVGINTSSPSDRLTVNGGATIIGDVIASGTGSQFIANSGDTISTPGFTWGGQEAQCGMFLVSSNTIGFSTAATERMRISSAGRIAIGHTDASAGAVSAKAISDFEASFIAISNDSANNWARIDLDNVNAAGNVILNQDNSGKFYIRNDVADANSVIVFQTNGSAERMRIIQTGEIGINNATPTWDVHAVISADVSQNTGLWVEDGSATNASPAIRSTGKRSDANGSQSFGGKLLLDHNRTDAAVGNNNKVGTVYFGGNHTSGAIGNILWAASISGISEGTYTNSTTMPTGIAFYTGSTGVQAHTSGTTAGTERMRITNTGFVGIGETSPLGNLHVKSGESSGTADSLADELVLESSGNAGLTVLSSATGSGSIYFGDSASNQIGRIQYTHTNDNMAFYTNGAQQLTINSLGRVGVGASDPLGKLHVFSSDTGGTPNTNADELILENNGNCGITILSGTASEGNIWFGDVTSATVGRIQYDHSGDFMRFYTNNLEAMRITSSGFLYLGTTDNTLFTAITGAGVTVTDEALVTIARDNGNATFITNKTDYVSGSTQHWILRENGANRGIITTNGSADGIRIDGYNNIVFLTQTGERARITSSQLNLATGVNLVTTDGLIRPNGSTTDGDATSPHYGFNTDTNTGMFRAGVDTLAFTTAGTERARFTSTGILLVGQTATTGVGTLRMTDAVSIIRNTDDWLLYHSRTDGSQICGIKSSGHSANVHIDFHTNNTYRARVSNTGTFMIGTTDGVLYDNTTGSGFAYIPAQGLTVARDDSSECFLSNKTDYVSGTTTHVVFRENGTTRGSISSNGTNTAYNTSSDYRLKENVVLLTDGIDRVMALKPSRFNFIGQEMTVDGFIAHEVQEVVPEAVTGEKDGEEMQQMDAAKLIPVLTAALKEAIAKIEELEARVSALEGIN